MALSEKELETLQALEKSLQQEDPKLASRMSEAPGPGGFSSKHLVMGLLVLLAGLSLLVYGISIQQPWVGVGGFLVAFGGCVVATRKSGPGKLPVRGSREDRARESSGFMKNLEAKWNDHHGKKDD